jgi:hypothetical protein
MLAKAHGVDAADLPRLVEMIESELSDDEHAAALADVRSWKPTSGN